MIEIITGVAGLLGLSAKDLSKAVLEVRTRKAQDKIARTRVKEGLYASPKAMAEVLSKYYGYSNTGSNLCRYSATIDGTIHDTSVFTVDRHLALFEDPRDINMSLVSDHSTRSGDPTRLAAVIDYAPEVIERLEAMEVKIWNDPLYRLLSVSTESKLSVAFGITDFLSYRFTTGLLADELTDALVATEGSTDKILANAPGYLPVRAEILPDLSCLDDFASHICAGGIGVLLAIARGKPYDDFVIPLQVRSSSVSDGRNQLAVFPKAFHQPVTGSDDEVNLYWTILREIYEEVYGHPEVEHESHKLKHDWFVDEEPGVAYLRDHLGAYNIEVLGFGLNAVAGNYDFGILLAIRDTWYWNTFGNKLSKNWEADKLISVSSKDKARIGDLLLNGAWTNESVPHIVEGLLRLKEIEPRKVALPNIQSSLAGCR